MRAMFFIYLFALGLSCSIQNFLLLVLQQVASLVEAWELLAASCGI